MTWAVEVRELRGDEEAILSVLRRAGYDMQALQESASRYLLRHNSYAEAADSSAVWADAKALKQKLQDFSMVDGCLSLGLELGSVRRYKSDGTFNRHHFAEGHAGIVLSVSATASVERNPTISDEERERLVREQQAREEAKRRSEAINRATAALQQPAVLKVLELLRLPSPTGTELGHLVDLVRDASGGDLSKYASRVDIARFERSINHPEVLGLKARHATSNVQPPPRPMRLEEAIPFAQGIARAWIRQIGEDG